jgi:hypothetical protein
MSAFVFLFENNHACRIAAAELLVRRLLSAEVDQGGGRRPDLYHQQQRRHGAPGGIDLLHRHFLMRVGRPGSR